MERGCIQVLPNFFRVPFIIFGTGKATDSKFGQYIQRVHPNKSSLKNFREKGAWAYPGIAHFSGTPYYPSNWQSYELQILHAQL